MHVIIEHCAGQITNVVVATVAAQVRRTVPVAADPVRLAAYLAANAGKAVLQSDYETATHQFEPRLLLVVNNQVMQLAADTLVMAANKLGGGAPFLLDLLQSWPSGKYRVIEGKVVLDPAWQEPTLWLTAPDHPC